MQHSKEAVLVTGGAGYIGSHTAKALAQAGYLPVTLDNLSNGHAWAVQWGPFIEGDLADKALIIDTIRTYNITSVIHFAASAYVGESMRNPMRYFRNNVANTLNLLEAMAETGVGKIVFSSTCATYGVPNAVPIDEKHSQQPINPYGESKVMVERMLKWCEEAHGIHWVALRYFNAAGADPEGEIGESHQPETHLIPLTIMAALGLRPALHIFGTDYPTVDGSAVRDYIHVLDLADAHLKAISYLEDGKPGIAINLGTGKGQSVRQVIDAVTEAVGKPVPYIEAERRAGDPPSLVADPTLANKVLGWHPKYSDLKTIVDTATRWHVQKHEAAVAA